MRSILLLAVFLPGLAAAQTASVLEVGERVRITKIMNPYEPRRTGVVTSLGGDSATITLNLEPPSTRAYALSRIEVVRGQRTRLREGAGIGTLVGLVGGFMLGFGAGDDCTGTRTFAPCFDRGSTGAMGGLFGALLGSVSGMIIGSLSKTDNWVRVVPGPSRK